MSSGQPNSSNPIQFDRADYAPGATTASACVVCKQPIGSTYYSANSRIVCPTCKQRLTTMAEQGFNFPNLSKAFVAGLGAALVGAAIYYAVLAATNFNLSIIAILVGYMVGRAVRWGSRNIGGVPYQVLAVVLTYFAIAGTYFPFFAQGLASRGISAASLLTNPRFLWLLIQFPVRSGLENPIGILITVIGLAAAARQTKGLQFNFTGPFEMRGAGN